MTSIFHQITARAWTADLDYGAPGPSAGMRAADFAAVARIELAMALRWGAIHRQRRSEGDRERIAIAHNARLDHLIAARAALRISRHGNHWSI